MTRCHPLQIAFLTLCLHQVLVKISGHALRDVDTTGRRIGSETGEKVKSLESHMCSPTPDFIGQSEKDIDGMGTTVPPEEVTSFYSSHTGPTKSSLYSTKNRSLKNIDVSAITVGDISTMMGKVKDEMKSLYASVQISLSEFNATLRAVQTGQSRESLKSGNKRGPKKKKMKADLDSIFKMSGAKKDQSSECPDMFVKFWGRNGRARISTCLFFSNITGSWAEAFVYCRIMGSDLAILNNLVLHDNVNSYMKGFANDSLYYLGGMDYHKEGAWRWLKPKKHFPHKRLWVDGQPDNVNNAEHCLAIGQHHREYKWTDVRCDRRLQFICQRKP